MMHIPSPLAQRQDAVFVFIDMQERLLPHIHEHERVLDNCVKLAKFARILRLPILVCEQEKLGKTVTALNDALEDFTPICKRHFGCFGDETFARSIGPLGSKTLVLAGIESHVCILQTALQALDFHAVHVIADATGSRAHFNWEMAMARLRHAGVVVSCTEMIIFELLGQAGGDVFSQVLPLVR